MSLFMCKINKINQISHKISKPFIIKFKIWQKQMNINNSNYRINRDKFNSKIIFKKNTKWLILSQTNRKVIMIYM